MKNKDYINGSLGDRMSSYENEYQTYLDKFKWTVIRLDGRSFSKFTKHFKEPFDNLFIECMNSSVKALFDSITNIKYGYTQSDEMTIIMPPVNDVESELPFGGRTDKILSLTASTVTGEFIKQLLLTELFSIDDIFDKKLPQFDSRYFQVDSETEAINALISRQNDCYRNAVSSIAQYYFSHRELLNKKVDDMIFMLESEKNVKLEDFHSHYLLGRLITKKKITYFNDKNEEYIRTKTEVESETIRFRQMFDDVFEEVIN